MARSLVSALYGQNLACGLLCCSCECVITLVNTSTLPIEVITVDFDSKLNQGMCCKLLYTCIKALNLCHININSFVCLFIYPFIRSFIWSFIHLVIANPDLLFLSIHSFTHSRIHSLLTHKIHSFLFFSRFPAASVGMERR